MAYNGKTNWVNNEIVEAVDMNRIEQGVADAHLTADTAISGISSLTTTVNGKSEIGHGHSIADVGGLATALSDNADAIAENAANIGLLKEITVYMTEGDGASPFNALKRVFNSLTGGIPLKIVIRGGVWGSDAIVEGFKTSPTFATFWIHSYTGLPRQIKLINGNWHEISTLSSSSLSSHTAEDVTQAGGVHGLEVKKGTWTPILNNSNGQPYSLVSASGTFMRTGDKIECWFEIESADELSDPHYVVMSGLPFVPRNLGHVGSASSTQTTQGSTSVHSIRISSANVCYIYNLRVGTTTTNFSFSNKISGYFAYLT